MDQRETINETNLLAEQLTDIDEDFKYKERKRLLLWGLPWTFTVYKVSPALLTTIQGLITKTENDCYLYKIQDVILKTSLIERIFDLGTVICYTGDVTNPEIHIKHIRKAREIKNYILKYSEVARIKRRTINMLDIGTADASDIM